MGDVRLRQVAVAALDGARGGRAARCHLWALYGIPGSRSRRVRSGEPCLRSRRSVFGTRVPSHRTRRRCGDSSRREVADAAGYMVVLEVDSVDPYRARAETLRHRVVLDAESETWSTLHLHPRDMGSLMSVDHDKGGDWMPAGPDWQDRPGASAITGIAGVRIATSDPVALANRWATFLDIPYSSGSCVTAESRDD